jgi:predicted phosphoadenosine phosphosulfate sulfurtransferase
MKYYKNTNVLEEALNRINYLYDNFDNVIVSFSGGKDSTICLELCLQVARERNRLPQKVFFIDQEAEWTQTIDYVKEVMFRPEVAPLWYQIPVKIENSATFSATYQNCWGEGEEWLREKEEISIKENKYNCEKWTDGIFDAISKVDFPRGTIFIGGVRAEESPTRLMALTSNATYQWVTWGKLLNKELQQYTFYPIYDWSYTDVWKFIHDKKVNYNKIYDYMYMYGVKVPAMRVSNLHHETAVRSLFYLQEFDRELYNKMVVRMPGISTAGHFNSDDDFFIKTLPYMFKDWAEYRDYLLDKLVTDESLIALVKGFTTYTDDLFKDEPVLRQKAIRCALNVIVTGDVTGTKFKNFKSTYIGHYKKDKREAEKILKQIENDRQS